MTHCRKSQGIRTDFMAILVGYFSLGQIAGLDMGLIMLSIKPRL